MDYEGEIVRQLPWLRKMAYMYCRQDADMEDLVSDTVLKLLLAKDVFKEKHAFPQFRVQRDAARVHQQVQPKEMRRIR